MTRICLILIILSAVLTVTTCRAEEYSTISHSTVMGRNYNSPTTGEVGQLILLTETAFFFKTLEIFNLDNTQGETFTGYRLPIRLGYRPRHDLALEWGALLGHDFGDPNRLNRAAPLVRLTYQPTAGLFILGGTLLPTHWLHDACHDDVQVFRTDVEQGFQLRADQSWLKNDTWINWRTREGGVAAEEFEIGTTSQICLLNDVLRLDGQFLWTHAGGQISTSSRIEQNLVFMTGFSLGATSPLAWQALTEVRLGWSYLYSRDEDDHTSLHKGFGRAYSVHADFRVMSHFTVRAFGEIFHGDNFISPLGDPLYQLAEYNQLGTNFLFNVGGDQLFIEAGFVNQWTDDVSNLTYQLSMIWSDGFPLISPR